MKEYLEAIEKEFADYDSVIVDCLEDNQLIFRFNDHGTSGQILITTDDCSLTIGIGENGLIHEVSGIDQIISEIRDNLIYLED